MDNPKEKGRKAFIDPVQVKSLIAIVVLVAVGIGYFNYFKPYTEAKERCESRVIYQPAITESDNVFQPAEGEHYLYGRKKFKTKAEALDYCVDTSTR